MTKPQPAIAPESAYEVTEVGSITIVVDHLQDLAGKTVIKAVFGTDTAAEAILDQVKYFQQSGLLLDSGVRAMIAAGENNVGKCAYVYHVNDRQTQIIVDQELFDATLENPEMGKGSYLETFVSFSIMATELQRAANAAGEGSPILLFHAGA